METLIDLRTALTRDQIKAMPIVVAMTTAGTKAETREEDGNSFRDAGLMRVQLIDGVRSIKVILFEGATSWDLDQLRNAAAETRNFGRPLDGPALGWKRVERDWADELTFVYRFLLMPVAPQAEASLPVVPCTIDACPESWHSMTDRHTILSIHRQQLMMNYSITIEQDIEDVDGRGWYVNVYADDFFGTATEAAVFAEDLRDAANACQRANAGLLDDLLQTGLAS